MAIERPEHQTFVALQIIFLNAVDPLYYLSLLCTIRSISFEFS